MKATQIVPSPATLKLKRKIISMISLALLIVAFIWFCYENFKIGGTSLVNNGLFFGWKFFLGIMPIIVVFALISGQLNAHFVKKPQHIGEIVAGKSVIKAGIVGCLTPGGSTMGPILQTKWNSDGNKYSIIAFLITMSMVNWTTLMFRLPFLGGKLTSIVFAVGFVISLFMVLLLSDIQRIQSS